MKKYLLKTKSGTTYPISESIQISVVNILLMNRDERPGFVVLKDSGSVINVDSISEIEAIEGW